ncbi:hypothetical protein, partial [Pseudalkalibacillus sp. NRS-1564]|uniref:hypothetical protein n=1 Tax=Pseudalkalibacillus sp. NRS-1564 TaxID=3233900 RepID=UPI003D282FBC
FHWSRTVLVIHFLPIEVHRDRFLVPAYTSDGSEEGHGLDPSLPSIRSTYYKKMIHSCHK